MTAHSFNNEALVMAKEEETATSTSSFTSFENHLTVEKRIKRFVELSKTDFTQIENLFKLCSTMEQYFNFLLDLLVGWFLKSFAFHGLNILSCQKRFSSYDIPLLGIHDFNRVHCDEKVISTITHLNMIRIVQIPREFIALICVHLKLVLSKFCYTS